MQFIKLGDCNLALASISGFECSFAILKEELWQMQIRIYKDELF